MNRLALPLEVSQKSLALLLSGLLILSPMSASAAKKGDDSAKKLFTIGQAAEAREDYDAAYEAYKKAYAKTPQDLRMRTAFYRVRQTASSAHVTQGRKMAQVGDQDGALTQFMRASEIDPGNEAATQEIARIRAKVPSAGSERDEREFRGKRRSGGRGCSGAAEADLQRAADTAYDGGLEDRLPGDRQGCGHQCAV